MMWPRILILVATLALFLPMMAIYFYRAYEDNYKRVAKVLKGLNYFLVAGLILHGTFGVVSVERFATYMILAVGLIALLEIAYHVDVILDIYDHYVTSRLRKKKE